MNFSDIFFIYIFLPLFLLFYLAARGTKAKNAVLIIFSLAFYAWGEPVWIALLLLTSVMDFLNCRFMERHRGEKKAAAGIIISCVVNLGILFVFKYSPMLIGGINSLLSVNLPVPEFDHLPMGISFYTFRSISCTADVYRQKVKAPKSYFGYLAYISMFFLIVQGPIVRYSDISRELDNRAVKTADFRQGISRLIFGLGKKVIIASSLGALADEFLGFETAPDSVLAAWAGVLLYTLQIYYDFSGYSDMAIGLGQMCGFHFPENFNYPYASFSVTEFWRRWHISLGTFFRDYVYIPLGGNRKHQILNIAVVWLLTGLWHGASFNFILWGLYFGVLLVIEKKLLLKPLEKAPKIIGHIYLIIIVVFGWAIFYFTDISRLGICLGAMFGANGIDMTDLLTESKLKGALWLIIAAVIFCAPVYGKISAWAEKAAKGSAAGFIAVSAMKIIFMGFVLFASTVSLVGDTYYPFLYANF